MSDRPYPRERSVPNRDSKITPEKGGVGKLTGRQEMAYVRNRYQKQLDIDNSDVIRKIWDIETIFKDIHITRNDVDRLKQDTDRHLEERDRIYTNLQNILVKEEGYEEKMLSETMKGMKTKGPVTVKQKLKDVDIDTIQVGSVEQYKRLYPHYGKEVFTNVNQFKDKEKEIRQIQEEHNQAVSRFNALLENASVGMLKAEDNFAKYDRTKSEGEKELASCRYYNSVFYKVSSKKTKVELSVDTLGHNIEKFRHTLQLLKDEYSTYKAKPLELIKY